MGFDRQIVRWMAVMILAIIACVAPYAAEAHEGHAHCTRLRHAAPASAAPWRIGEALNKLPNAPRLRMASVRSTASLQAYEAGGGCRPGPCKCCGCGTAVFGTVGIVAGPASLSAPLLHAVMLIPADAAVPAEVGPDAVRKPPRTFA